MKTTKKSLPMLVITDESNGASRRAAIAADHAASLAETRCKCGYLIPESEARAGFTTCEFCDRISKF